MPPAVEQLGPWHRLWKHGFARHGFGTPSPPADGLLPGQRKTFNSDDTDRDLRSLNMEKKHHWKWGFNRFNETEWYWMGFEQPSVVFVGWSSPIQLDGCFITITPTVDLVNQQTKLANYEAPTLCRGSSFKKHHGLATSFSGHVTRNNSRGCLWMVLTIGGHHDLILIYGDKNSPINAINHDHAPMLYALKNHAEVAEMLPKFLAVHLI